MIRRPPRSPLFPYTTLSRSHMNPRLEALHAYPFERLARLKAGITAPSQLEPIAMSIGEPQHTPPAFLLEALRRHLRSEEHTSELQSRLHLVCRLLLEKKNRI